MDIILDIVLLTAAIALSIGALLYIFRVIIEPTYIMLFNKPVFVHFYPFLKSLDGGKEAVLHQNFKFYRDLSARRKAWFRHRVARFINKYDFASRDGLVVTDEMQLKIAAVWVMLSFGMRNYLPRIFSTIILYPDAFTSGNGQGYHKGEFNPKVKAVVFSWKHFAEGLTFDNDNLNLGLHEFAHVLHFSSIRRWSSGASSVIYGDMFRKLLQYIDDPDNRQQLIAEGYFREYAYTNQYEFVAVLLEHFFETPDAFRKKFPELYTIVKKMINFSEG